MYMYPRPMGALIFLVLLTCGKLYLLVLLKTYSMHPWSTNWKSVKQGETTLVGRKEGQFDNAYLAPLL